METQQRATQHMKKCPYCAEEIREEAIFCRYCKRDLPIPNAPSTPTDQSKINNAKSAKKGSKKALIIISILVFSLVVFSGLFVYYLKFGNSFLIANDVKYRDQMSKIMNEYLENISEIQTILSTDDAVWIVAGRQQFQEKLIPPITQVKILQQQMDELKPPERLLPLHKDISNSFRHFTNAAIAMEKWDQTSDTSYLETAAIEIDVFNSDVDQLYNLMTEVNNVGK